jgi:hypothetical protein
MLRIALGETLVPTAAGLLAGTGSFLLARTFADRVSLFEIGVFPADVRPVPALAATAVLAAIGAALVLLCTVAVLLHATRRVTSTEQLHHE